MHTDGATERHGTVVTRRRFLATAAAAALAGCSGDGGATTEDGATTAGTTTERTTAGTTTERTTAGTTTGETTDVVERPLPPDDDPSDGYPPAFERTPPATDADPSSFDTVFQSGVEILLVPIDVAIDWYRRRSARFVDARGEASYENSHVYGAVLSPAPDGIEDDPVAAWPTEDRIVTYCGCPHHLSSMRAAALIRGGYETVYALDEGFWTWHDRGYPMAGSEVDLRPALHRIRGRTAPRYAGESAWAWHRPTGQREAAPIRSDGTYDLELRFAGVTPSSTVEVRTPGYAVRGSILALSDGVVTATRATE